MRRCLAAFPSGGRFCDTRLSECNRNNNYSTNTNDNNNNNDNNNDNNSKSKSKSKGNSNSNSNITTVSFHNFKSQDFKLSVSNPKSKYVAYVSVLSQISNCQGLGRKNEHEILKTDRTRSFECNRLMRKMVDNDHITGQMQLSDPGNNKLRTPGPSSKLLNFHSVSIARFPLTRFSVWVAGLGCSGTYVLHYQR